MAARGSKSAQERTQAERARIYAARTAQHQEKIRRRVRDNVIAGVGGAVLVLAAIASQVAHAQVTAPEPAPTPSSSVEPTAPAETPAPTEAPAPEETPAE